MRSSFKGYFSFKYLFMLANKVILSSKIYTRSTLEINEKELLGSVALSFRSSISF